VRERQQSDKSAQYTGNWETGREAALPFGAEFDSSAPDNQDRLCGCAENGVLCVFFAAAAGTG
jgi:hypothetical protein